MKFLEFISCCCTNEFENLDVEYMKILKSIESKLEATTDCNKKIEILGEFEKTYTRIPDIWEFETEM